jgi:bifunctional NMN adenylyltransferase/nudix hydrolase
MHKYGVLIGRFQPFHNAHLETVRFALEHVERLIIVLGSHNRARDIRNPWSTDERVTMIDSCLSHDDNERIEFVKASDYDYNDLLWVATVQEAIHEVTNGSTDVKLIGHRKDATSFYLNLFPQWGDHIETGISMNVDASKVREMMFGLDTIGIKDMVPSNVYGMLITYMSTPEFKRLHDEYHDILADKVAWSGAPYQPTFVTTDAIVICSGHVLVVRRRGRYGKGLIALPGGYIKPSESIQNGCIRELKEETGIKIDSQTLRTHCVDSHVFDNPTRDLRGRVITHAFCFRLLDGELPRVKGMDDADRAWWMPLRTVWASEEKFFCDHFHIINSFCNRMS